MKSTNILFILAIALALSGCTPVKPKDDTQIDQCIRNELFQQCMSVIPTGPTHLTETKNQWSDVIEACENQATHASYRLTSVVKLECRSMPQ